MFNRDVESIQEVGVGILASKKLQIYNLQPGTLKLGTRFPFSYIPTSIGSGVVR